MDTFDKRQLNRQKMMCVKCAFIYTPEYGDQESNIDPWTNFEDIPENWRCPICDAAKETFVPCPDIITEEAEQMAP